MQRYSITESSCTSVLFLLRRLLLDHKKFKGRPQLHPWRAGRESQREVRTAQRSPGSESQSQPCRRGQGRPAGAAGGEREEEEPRGPGLGQRHRQEVGQHQAREDQQQHGQVMILSQGGRGMDAASSINGISTRVYSRNLQAFVFKLVLLDAYFYGCCSFHY